MNKIDLKQMRIWDEYAIQKYNRTVRERAIAEGREEGRAEDLAEGREEGKSLKAREMAKGFPGISGLSVEEIQKL